MKRLLQVVFGNSGGFWQRPAATLGLYSVTAVQYFLDRIPTVEHLSRALELKRRKSKRFYIRLVLNMACSEYGFFKIVNHGIPKGLMSRALELSKMFFEHPDEEKLKYSLATPPVGCNRDSNSCMGQNESTFGSLTNKI
ncbi:hypothetical protein C5167_018147 [Papaver somniferum]|uniref:Non-haem dioxygenase N-terminal domain-containing protein n=1 Tax=Papaver somniferum TaxID=3469 RepID=A0A4Y7IQG6_PAPSO|nr:hypothetical protein C5167_018147 [Papaver somniferum]